MNPSFTQQNGFMNGSLGQGMSSNGLMGGQGGMNSPMGGGMGNNMMNMMGGGGMNPQMMARGMMNGGGQGMGQMGNMGLGGMSGGMGGGMGGSMGGMGPSGMGGGGMGGGNVWNNMNNMGGGGVGGSMSGGGGMGGMGMGGGGGMGGNHMGNGGMVGSMGHNRTNGGNGNFNGGNGVLTQEQRSQLMSQAMQSLGITRDQFAAMPQAQQLNVQERLRGAVASMTQRMAQETMMGNLHSHQQSPASSHGFPGGGDRPGSTNPSMMPPPPPIRPNTSMSSRSRAPSMESMRPPSAMGMGSPFPKGGMNDQSPIGGSFPKGNTVESSPTGPYSHASPSASRVPESPRLDGMPAGFPSSSGMGSPTRPMSSASNHSGFSLSAPPVRRASISRAATATPVNSEQQIEPTPQTPSFPPPSTPTPAPAETQAVSDMAHPVSPPATPAPAEASSQTVRRLPPLPANLNKAMTEISMVPLKDSEKLIPALDSTQISQVKDWIKADTEYEQTYREMLTRMEKEREALGRRWWERGGGAHGGLPRALNTRNRFDVRYPAARIRKEASNKKGRVERREGFRLPRKIDPKKAEIPEELVPIRLELDVEQHQKLRETFVWNLHDPVVTPELFAQLLVEDYKLGQSSHAAVVKQIQDQISDYKAHSANYDGDEGACLRDHSSIPSQVGALRPDDAQWWRRWRKRLRTDLAEDASSSKRGRIEDDEALYVDTLSVNEGEAREDLRILIKLDIVVGATKLDDQFEWDLDNEDASPEAFAEVFTMELGIASEFKTAIAHAIREQIQTYQKSLFIAGHPADGSAIQDEDLKAVFLPPVTTATVARPVNEVAAFTPMLNYMSDGELDKYDKDSTRDYNKRKKRNPRGRRNVLPDRDAIKTYRSPAIGFPPVDPSVLAQQAAVNAPTSRRAAAAAASLTIASLAASENQSPTMGNSALPMSMTSTPNPHQQQQQQQIQAVPKEKKEKKPKYIYKPPAPPEHTLKARSRAPAPTPSTAIDIPKPKGEPNEEPEREILQDGQHSNMVNGTWHCSNCGCPEDLAHGKRKGPLGDRTQCSACSKYWHRHKKPRPVDYILDRNAHGPDRPSGLLLKTPQRRRVGNNNREMSPKVKQDEDMESVHLTRVDNTVALSPVSSASSMSDPPTSNGKASRVNGSVHIPPEVELSPTPAHLAVSSPAGSGATRSGSSGPWNSKAPTWLQGAMTNLQARFPQDRFELIQKKASSDDNWRIKCLDCPGKLYKPGPDETLNNFEGHLRFTGHTKTVEKRMGLSG